MLGYRNMMRVLVHIPARGGSKGLARKNLALVGGLSLVARSVRAAQGFVRAVALTEATIFVDTDDAEIAAEGRLFGAEVPFLREPTLARDDTPTAATLLGALEAWATRDRHFDAIVLLQPTTPLRETEEIVRCWQAFHPNDRPSVASITPHAHPVQQAVTLSSEAVLQWALDGVAHAGPRQAFSPTYRFSGSVYVASVAFLTSERAVALVGRTTGVVTDSLRAIDIDDVSDLEVARALVAKEHAPETQLAHRVIGAGHPPFLIAEAGVNHNGSAEMAHALVDCAADAGADAVKFQTFSPDDVASATAPKAEYQVERTGNGETQLEMLRRLALPHDVFSDLQRHAAERGLLFLSTAFDRASADFLVEHLALPALKVPSGELTNHSFIDYLARKGPPLLLSTGMANLAEVSAAFEVVSAAGGRVAAVFHCVTNYPTAPEDCNLRAMNTMRAAFGVPTGWSDHTEGIEITLAAVAAGAEILEKHFTLDRTLDGPDHAASLEPHELSSLVRNIKVVHDALGDGVKRPRPAELPLTVAARRSLHTTRALPVGHRLSHADVTALRPGDGESPARLNAMLGRAVRAGLPAGAKIFESDLE